MHVNGKDFVSVEEAAQIMGLHVTHVRRLAREGKIDGVKIGKVWVIPKEQALNYTPGPKGFAAHPRK